MATTHHSFDIEHAKAYGIDEAVFIHSLKWWAEKNRADGKFRHEERSWVRLSARAAQSLFPYWTPRQITRVVRSLSEKGIIRAEIRTGDDFNETAYDRTMWYAFEDERRFLAPFDQTVKCSYANGQIDQTERVNRSAQTVKCTKVVPGVPKNSKGGAGTYTEGGASPLIEHQAPYQADAPPTTPGKPPEPDPLFANPAGLPEPPRGVDPLKTAVDEALFVYCDEVGRVPWIDQVAETCRRYLAAGRPFKVEMLAVAAKAGRAAWYAEGKTTRPKFLNCFLDALAAEMAKPPAPSVSLTPAQVEYLRREEEERREWIAREREKARAAEEATAEERERRAAECVAAARRRFGRPPATAGVAR
jgi:hypothetical protein